MLFMVFGVCWVPIHELASNFGHLLHVTWRGTCRKSVFKLYKIHTKSKNHETLSRCHVIACVGCGKKLRRFRASGDIGCLKPTHLHMWSHVEMSGFQAFDVATRSKPSQFFTTQPTHAITWHLAKFRDFRTSYGFYIILKHFSDKSVVMLREEDAWNLMLVRG